MPLFGKNITHKILQFAIGIPILTSVFLFGANTINIMPLGDSITQGTDTNEPTQDIQTAYRHFLWYQLNDANYSVDFVGSQTGGSSITPPFDIDHEGYRGNTINDIRDGEYGVALHEDHPGIYGMLENQYSNGTSADVVLLHIGTNSVGENGLSTVTEVEGILSNIDDYENDYNQTVEVLIARIVDYQTHNPEMLLALMMP